MGPRLLAIASRRNEAMLVIAHRLNGQDIDDLAAYYAAIPGTVGVPPK